MSIKSTIGLYGEEDEEMMRELRLSKPLQNRSNDFRDLFDCR